MTRVCCLLVWLAAPTSYPLGGRKVKQALWDTHSKTVHYHLPQSNVHTTNSSMGKVHYFKNHCEEDQSTWDSLEVQLCLDVQQTHRSSFTMLANISSPNGLMISTIFLRTERASEMIL